MSHFLARRHRCLMDESEQALAAVAENVTLRESRIAKQVLTDPKIHRLWESRHAEIVRPVAEHNNRMPQILALRSIEASLLHRRALIDCIRKCQIVGAARDRLFRLFYGPKDAVDTILTEHRQYMLAVSSRISADHLISVMCDPDSTSLLELYETIYSKYFALYCLMVTSEDVDVANALGRAMRDSRRQAKSVRGQLHSVKPDNRFSSFDRQVSLARCGRYQMQDYMVG